MSRRNRGNNSDSGGGRSLGSTIGRILKIKFIILLVLIVLSIFGVLYIIDWFRGLFSSSAVCYVQPTTVVEHLENVVQYPVV